MCGRYTLIADIGDLAQRFEFDGADFSYDPGYNIAPTEACSLSGTSKVGRGCS